MTNIFIDSAEKWIQKHMQNKTLFNCSDFFYPNDIKLNDINNLKIITINSYGIYKTNKSSENKCFSIHLSNNQEVFFFFEQSKNYYIIVPLNNLELQGRLYPI